MDVYETVRRFLVERITGSDQSDLLTEDTNLQEAGILDSLSTLKLVSFLEETFSISFESSDLDRGGFSSLRNIEQLVNTKRMALNEPM